MSYKKRIGVIDQIPQQGLKVFVGYYECPYCNKTHKHYLSPEDARELAHTFVFDYKIDRIPIMDRIRMLLPRVSVTWSRE